MSLTDTDQRKYTAILCVDNGRFSIIQPELCLIASDDSMVAAYDKFAVIKDDFFQEIRRAGLEDQLPEIGARRHRKTTISRANGAVAELGMFFLRLCILVAVMGGVAAVGAIVVKRSIDRALSIAMAQGSPNLSFADIVNKLAEHAEAMPVERKEQLRHSVEILSREANQFIAAWRNSSSLSDTTAGQK